MIVTSNDVGTKQDLNQGPGAGVDGAGVCVCGRTRPSTWPKCRSDRSAHNHVILATDMTRDSVSLVTNTVLSAI